MHIQTFVWRVEAEARFTGCARAITCTGNISKYAVIFAHKGKSNKLRCSELNGVYFYLCALNKTRFYKIKKKKALASLT